MVLKILTDFAHVSFYLWKNCEIVGFHACDCLPPQLCHGSLPLHFSSVHGAEVRVLLLRYRDHCLETYAEGSRCLFAPCHAHVMCRARYMNTGTCERVRVRVRVRTRESESKRAHWHVRASKQARKSTRARTRDPELQICTSLARALSEKAKGRGGETEGGRESARARERTREREILVI